MRLNALDTVQPASVRHDLPARVTPFFGRVEEVAHLLTLLRTPDTRLITIHGIGGIGKTRLALEVAEQAHADFPEGVYYAALTAYDAPEDVVRVSAERIGLAVETGGDLAARLIRYLRAKRILLVLDNFEHLLDGGTFVADLLQQAPQVRVLATSRERLNLYGETVFTLGGLQDADSAVALFIQRARSARREFAPDEGARETIWRICQRVEGMPLAIELAAGWVNRLSLEEIADELTTSIDLLQTKLRDVAPRQRSIHAVFDRTWSRLDGCTRGTDRTSRVSRRLDARGSPNHRERGFALVERSGRQGIDRL
jgi:predicted ATPase